MYTVYIYISSFIQMMLINCVNPSNIVVCVSVHKWLPPYIHDLHTFITEPPYSNEKRGVQLRKEYERLHGNLL